MREELDSFPADPEVIVGAALETRPPLHLEATVRVLQRRPGNLVDVWERGSYLRALRLTGGLVLTEVRNHGAIDEPDLRLSMLEGESSARARAQAAAVIRRILGLDLDPAPLRRSLESEPAIRATGRALRGLRPPRFANLFEAFASIVPFQQLSLDAGVAIVGRLVDKFGAKLRHAGRRFHAFPTAERVAACRPDSLCACGFSRQKARTLIEVARVIASGDLDERKLDDMSTRDALARLMELPGIGPWSAGLVLLRGMGRLDVFPSGDVGAARGLRNLMGLGPHAPIEPVVERFGRYRGYLYFCALGASLLGKGLIEPAGMGNAD